ncbi:hypothetical protein SLEP1_g57598 [Rubroshorea leprosula]|uniref:PGG domain-containing protein n=1 Tax=Rubroshorea leprosula TaxID=152421 RepID=A0AAV5MM15_9ROSI|nr:hypothetical protein SLEP1_g57598 [Rubroshorea leprosula]
MTIYRAVLGALASRTLRPSLPLSLGHVRLFKPGTSARDVWDALAATHAPPVEVIVEPPPRKGPGNLADPQYKTLTDAISNGDLGQLQKFFGENLNPKSARIFENGYTALHFAVYNEKSIIVDYLIRYKLSEKDLETKDDYGSTALSIAARYGVGKSIAKSLVRMNKKLLTISDDYEKIPVELACSTIREDLTRYLYRKTPLEYLEGDRGFYILKECIIVKAHVIKEDKHRSCVEKMQDFLQPFTEGFERCVGLWSETLKQIRQEFEDENQRRIQENEETNQENQQTIQENEETNQENQENQWLIQETEETDLENQQTIQQTNQETNGDTEESSFIEKCVILLVLMAFVIIALPIAVPFLLIAFAVVITLEMLLSMLLLLGIWIQVALRLLASMLSRILAKNIYDGKLMDKYACEVISLICQPLSDSELDQKHFVQSGAAVNTIIHAIKNDIPIIVKEIIKANKNIFWRSLNLEDSRNMFARAVAHRQEEVAHLLYEFAKEDTNMVITIDKDGNNILHLAAKLAPPYQLGRISGSAFQLQNELRWFKGVGEIVPRSYRENKNNKGETPLEVFVREHKDLLKEAEEWGKRTAQSSTVVGALIITIMFAMAFTVPGGNDQSTGFPILLHKTPIPFMIFMVSDALSLFAASSSVIIFLGILTAHHAAEDYRKYSLVIWGLTFLFISIATMTIAFCAALFIMLQGRLVVVILITLVAGIPIKWFVQLQFPLLVDIFCLTLGPNLFDRREMSWMNRMIKGVVDLWMWSVGRFK